MNNPFDGDVSFDLSDTRRITLCGKPGEGLMITNYVRNGYGEGWKPCNGFMMSPGHAFRLGVQLINRTGNSKALASKYREERA